MGLITKERCRRVLKANKQLLTLDRQDPFTVLKIGTKGLKVRLDGWKNQDEKLISYDDLNGIIDEGRLEKAIDKGGKITNTLGSDTTYESYKYAIVVHVLDRYATYTRFKMSKWKWQLCWRGRTPRDRILMGSRRVTFRFERSVRLKRDAVVRGLELSRQLRELRLR